MSNIICTATCYIPYALLLFFAVLFLPALAFFPEMLASPCAATAIPIVSLMLINSIVLLLTAFGLYAHNMIILISALLSIIALIRIYYFHHSQPIRWQKQQLLLMLLNASLLLPLLAFAGISVFMYDDALASWNYWAMHYYHQTPPTSAETFGYPQFFPLFISYCYKLLGNPEYQGPVKALLVIFPFTIMNCIAFATYNTVRSLLLYLFVISVCVFPGFMTFGFYRFYGVGYADPMLAAALACSALLLIQYFQEPQQKQWLWYAVFCGITASLSKQPGLLWALFSVPVLFIAKFIQERKINLAELSGLFVLATPAATWLLGPGSHFYTNQGVIAASLHKSTISYQNVLLTLLQSMNKYFFTQPTLLALFVLGAIAAARHRYKLGIYITFVIPATLLWFIFGSYEIRLGLPILVTCGILVASENYFSERILQFFPRYKTIENAISAQFKTITYSFFLIGILFFIIFSIREQLNKHNNTTNLVDPLNAGKSTIYKYFSNGASFIYQTIYNNFTLKIWVPHNYIAGIFYGHTQMLPPGEIDKIKEIFRSERPDYVFTGGKIRTDQGTYVENLIKNCQASFIEIPLGTPVYDYHLYKLDKNKIKDCN